jgi:hypothetical protein
MYNLPTHYDPMWVYCLPQGHPCATRYKACEGPKVTYEVQANGGVRTGQSLRMTLNQTIYIIIHMCNYFFLPSNTYKDGDVIPKLAALWWHHHQMRDFVYGNGRSAAWGPHNLKHSHVEAPDKLPCESAFCTGLKLMNSQSTMKNVRNR